jgi:hypothetical protein
MYIFTWTTKFRRYQTAAEHSQEVKKKKKIELFNPKYILLYRRIINQN